MEQGQKVNRWGIVATVLAIISRLPLERFLPRTSDKDFERLSNRIAERAKGLQTQRPVIPTSTLSVSEEETLKYQLDLLLDDLQHLETEHLPNKGRIAGKPCDCISKAARDLRRHARETIPIAARQGKDAKLLSELSDWAQRLIDIGGVHAVASGQYDDIYLKEAGTASKFRKQVERMRSELSGCPECAEIRRLKDFISHR